MTAKICLALVRLFTKGPLRRFNHRERPVGARYESCDNYLADRLREIGEYRELFSPFCRFAGNTVVELGCSRGYLLNAFLRTEHFKAIGADIDPVPLSLGREEYPEIEFVQTTHACIPLPDESVGIIYTIDTVEHLIELEKVFNDCYRILRPQGRFLVHFGPWYNPNGTHLEDILPIPWLNVIFSMDTLLNVAAFLYDSDEYVPACYWFDPITGERRPNPYLDHKRWDEFLNRITLRRFRRILGCLPFKVVHYRQFGFGGRTYPLARTVRGLAHVPLLDEFFVKKVFCVLEKPETN